MIGQESLPNIPPPRVPENEFPAIDEILGLTLESSGSDTIFDDALDVLAFPDLDPKVRDVIVGLGRVAADSLRSNCTDELTGLLNRTGFGLRFSQVISEISEHQVPPVFLAYMDLDGFKGINDRLGHHKGDEVLVAMSRIHLREGEFLARVGGDEFVAVIFPENNSMQDSTDGTKGGVSRETHSEDDVIDGIVTRFRHEIESITGGIEECEGVSVSVGCVKVESYLLPEEILRSADARMRQEKEDRGASR